MITMGLYSFSYYYYFNLFHWESGQLSSKKALTGLLKSSKHLQQLGKSKRRLIPSGLGNCLEGGLCSCSTDPGLATLQVSRDGEVWG